MDSGGADAAAKAASSTETGPQVELPAKPTPTKRPRPAWNPEWDVSMGDEDDFGESLHKAKKGKVLNFESDKNKKEHLPLDDWDTLLSLSPLAVGNDPKTVTAQVKVKAFFVSSGYSCPRAALGITGEPLEKMLDHAKAQDHSSATIFTPQDMKQEIGIEQILNLVKEYQNLSVNLFGNFFQGQI